eukprot:scaffold528_cov165-Amphora_coffeaeformis.AAC.58
MKSDQGENPKCEDLDKAPSPLIVRSSIVDSILKEDHPIRTLDLAGVIDKQLQSIHPSNQNKIKELPSKTLLFDSLDSSQEVTRSILNGFLKRRHKIE